MANCLRVLDLLQCWAGIANGEEEFGIFVTAGRLMAPVHAILQC
jgi:hypothetical protein